MILPTRVWDPLYGRIDLSKYEYKLISLPEVQRLRGIRMCNINSLLVTGASEISRFEHTIGVLRLTQEWIKYHSISDQNAEDLIAAAILHDMQTGPFGHSLQYVLEENEVDGDFIHDDIAHGQRNYYHQDLIANASFAGRHFGADALLGSRWNSVGNIIRGEGLLGPIISGTMDLDNIDNVVRLAYHVGVANSEDSRLALSLARDMDVIDSELLFHESSLCDISRWLEIRRALYNLLLLDWAEFSAKAMFTRAVEIAINKKILGANSWVHTDAELLAILEKNGIGDAQGIGDLIKRLRVGDLYTPVVMLQSPSIEFYGNLSRTETKSKIESEIVEFAKKDLNTNVKIIIHLILDKGKTQRAVSIKVKETGENRLIGSSSKNLLVGLFVSKNSLTERSSNMLSTHITRVLSDFGLKDISSLDDPMGDTVSQMSPLSTQIKLI